MDYTVVVAVDDDVVDDYNVVVVDTVDDYYNVVGLSSTDWCYVLDYGLKSTSQTLENQYFVVFSTSSLSTLEEPSFDPCYLVILAVKG